MNEATLERSFASYEQVIAALIRRGCTSAFLKPLALNQDNDKNQIYFGGASIQVARRLCAMLEDLIETLPPERAEPLRAELQLLKKLAERFFHDPEDRALAERVDFQVVARTIELDERGKAVDRMPEARDQD